MAAAKHVRSLSRGLQILKVLRGADSASLAEIHDATQMPRPTILRILGTLEAEGFVRRWMTDGRYRLRAISQSLAFAPHLSDLIADVAAPSLEKLVQRVAWPSDIAVYDDCRMLLAESTRRRTRHFINFVEPGYRVHMLQSAVGRAYLAFCDDTQRESILTKLRSSKDRYDRHSRDAAFVRDILDSTRVAGYAVRQRGYWATNRRLPLDLNAIAIPIVCTGRVVACLSTPWVSNAMSKESFAARNLGHMRRAADLIAKQIEQDIALSVLVQKLSAM